MPTRNVNLTEHSNSFIDASIAAGRFGNASEAVEAGVCLLERQETEDRVKLDWLRDAALDGIDAMDRGDYTSLRSREQISALVRSAGSGRG